MSFERAQRGEKAGHPAAISRLVSQASARNPVLSVLQLQRMAGNRAVVHALQRLGESPAIQSECAEAISRRNWEELARLLSADANSYGSVRAWQENAQWAVDVLLDLTTDQLGLVLPHVTDRELKGVIRQYQELALAYGEAQAAGDIANTDARPEYSRRLSFELSETSSYSESSGGTGTQSETGSDAAVPEDFERDAMGEAARVSQGRRQKRRPRALTIETGHGVGTSAGAPPPRPPRSPLRTARPPSPVPPLPTARPLLPPTPLGETGDTSASVDLGPPRAALPPLSPRSPARERNPDQLRFGRPLTTTDYGVVDLRGEGVLFNKPARTPGGSRIGWQTPRALKGANNPSSLAMPEQVYEETLIADHPKLRISEDRTLAVEEGNDGQQVFATPEAVNRANVKLSRSGSTVKLLADKELRIALTTDDGNVNALLRVTPRFLTRDGKDTKSEEEGGNEFAQMLADTGRASHVVFRPPQGGAAVTAPVSASDAHEVTGTHHLADALGKIADQRRSGGETPEWAASLVRQDKRVQGGPEVPGPMPGKAYGSALSLAKHVDNRRDALSAAADRIGVNEHAWADVGEGYLTQSIAEPDADGKPILQNNYAKPQFNSSGAHKGYQFVAVVLASEDGRHQISLENSSTKAVKAERREPALKQNLDQYDLGALEQMERSLEQAIEDADREGRQKEGVEEHEGRVKELKEHVKELGKHRTLAQALARVKKAEAERDATFDGSPERTKAEQKLKAATKSAMAGIEKAEPTVPGSDQWYMRMYSRRPGESVHDTTAGLLREGQSVVANPLTAVVLRGQEALPVSVSFDDDAEMPDGDSVKFKIPGLARKVARIGLWNVTNRYPPPGVKITGEWASPSVGFFDRRAKKLAKKRAGNRSAKSEGLFKEELRKELEARQADAPGPHVTVDEFTFDVELRDTGKPTAAATVVITFDDRRGGAREREDRDSRKGPR